MDQCKPQDHLHAPSRPLQPLINPCKPQSHPSGYQQEPFSPWQALATPQSTLYTTEAPLAPERPMQAKIFTSLHTSNTSNIPHTPETILCIRLTKKIILCTTRSRLFSSKIHFMSCT